MAVRVPRVAVEAVAAALLIGAGCFMLLDLSGKQTVTAMGGATFSAKLEGKFATLATTPMAILPVPCVGAETTISATLPGVCNLAAGKTGCCNADKLNARLLPDLSNCTTRCQSYYISFFCFQSCKAATFTPQATATGSICTPILQTLFNACNTPTCKVLNPGTVSGGDIDFTNFLSTNSIKADTTGSCLDFTSFGRRCEETQAPTIRTLNVFQDNNDADVTDDRTAVTSITDGAASPFNFKTLTSGSAVDATFGAVIRVCTDIVNPRPTDCTTQPPGVGSYPLSANIVVEAQGAVAYTVVNAVISSQDMVQIPGVDGQPTVYRACVNDIRILPLNREAYTLAISASAVNTFGTGTSAGVSTTATPPNQLTVNVAASNTAVLLTGAYSLSADVQVCATSTSTNSIIVGSNQFFVPLNDNTAGIPNYPDSFTVNTINCCETASTAPDGTLSANVNNGLRQECTINGLGTAKPLIATNFVAVGVNGQTTIRLVQLQIKNTFTALGSITLVNAAITINSGGNFLVTGATALRGGTATALNILADASLTLSASVFLITLGSIDVKTGVNSNIKLNTLSRLVVAETSRMISDSSQFAIDARARLVQYTSAPGGITVFAKTAAVTVAGTSELTGIVTGVVAVSGTYVSYNDPTAARSVTYNPETRVSLSRGPTAKDPVDATSPTGRGDGNAVPEDSEVPLEVPVTFQRSTGKKFQELVATPANTRAVLQLCGTSHTTVTIPAQGTLLVSPPAGYTGARCQVTGLAGNSLSINTLNVAAGGIISVTGVDAGFLPIRVTNAFNVAQAAIIQVTLAAGISTAAIASLPIFDVTGTAAINTNLCNILANIEIVNQGNRVVTPSCTANIISLAFTAVQATPPPQFNAGLFTSNLEYCLLLRQSVGSFDRSTFLTAIDNNFGPDTTRSVVAISSFTTDSDNTDNLRIRFRCYDYSSIANADTRCSNIVNVATQSSSGFRSAVLAVGNCGAVNLNDIDNDDSNHGLYGLFGLIAIPIICLLVLCLVIRNSRRRADNQYMQDAATFSNVASGPQPLATAVPSVQYDVAKEIYPAIAPAYPAYPAY